MEKNIILQNQIGSSDKVYALSLARAGRRFVVSARFGRRGNHLNTVLKTAGRVSYDTALSTFNKVLRSKLNRGYSEVR